MQLLDGGVIDQIARTDGRLWNLTIKGLIVTAPMPPGKNGSTHAPARAEISRLPFVLVEFGSVKGHSESLAPPQWTENCVEQRSFHDTGSTDDCAPKVRVKDPSSNCFGRISARRPTAPASMPISAAAE
jgi:hypothetical protein